MPDRIQPLLPACIGRADTYEMCLDYQVPRRIEASRTLLRPRGRSVSILVSVGEKPRDQT